MKLPGTSFAGLVNGFPGWGLVILAGLMAHGLIPLTDYILWDGWWYSSDLIRGGGTPTMARLFHEVGRPLDMLFYLPMKVFPGDPVARAKWLGLIAWISSAMCMRIVLQRLGGLHRVIATAVSVIAVTAPTFDLLGELSLWMNTACVLLFWVAWVIVGLQKGSGGWKFVALRILGCALFFLSFNLNSNLVMFYGVASMVAGLRLIGEGRATLWSRLPRLVAQNADYLVLPIVFWLWKTLFTPTSGYYAEGYNQPSLDPLRLMAGYGSLAVNYLSAGVGELLASPEGVGAAVLAAIVSVVLWSRSTPEQETGSPLPGLSLCGSGIFLLAVAAFPYLAVGQDLTSEGWLSRNAILCNLPVALIAVGGFIAINARLIPTRPRLWMAGVVALAALGAGNCQRNYLALQAFGAKERSVQRKLMAAIAQYKPSVVQLRDYFHLPGTIPYYPPAIWTFLSSGNAAPTTFVIDTRAIAPDQTASTEGGRLEIVMPQLNPSSREIDEAIEATTMPYAMENIPRSGPQILFAILPGTLGNDSVQLGLRYLGLKQFDPESRKDFEDRLTETRVVVLPEISGD